METQNESFTILFEKDAEVILELAGEMDGALVYRTIKHCYDADKGDKSKLTISVEISPLSEQHKRLLLSKRKTQENIEAKSNELTNGEC